MRHLLLLILTVLLTMACEVPTEPPTKIPLAPTETPAPTPVPTPTDQDYLSHFENVVAAQHVPEITDTMLKDACLIQEYFGWPESSSDFDDPDTQDAQVVGGILSSTEPRYAMDVGIVAGSMVVIPVDLRRRYCVKYR